jgi:hypothetical protein
MGMRRRETNRLLAEILAEVKILRELAILEMRFPDLTEAEREMALRRIKGWQG